MRRKPTLSPPDWPALDRALGQAMHRATARPSVLLLLTGVAWLSDGIVWYATVLLLPWIDGANGSTWALRMVGLGIVDALICGIGKRHFARRRPFIACPGVRACARPAEGYSFPSGHAMHAVAFAVLLGAYEPALGWVLWPFAAAVAASRVMLGLHYPSDAVVGSALGAFMATLVLALF